MKKNSISIQYFFETLIKEKEAQTNLLIEMHDKALSLSKVELERRLDGLNELRKEVERDRILFMRQDIYDADKKAQSIEIRSLSDKTLTLMNHNDIKNRNMWIALIINFIVAIVLLIKELIVK